MTFWPFVRSSKPSSPQEEKDAAPSVAPVRLLIVDDSGFMRVALRKMLQREPMIRIVGEAVGGRDAIEQTHRLRPDVVLMDAEMPEMDGVEATRIIMRQRPTPIIMTSAANVLDAEVTLRLLRDGAVDFISKPEKDESLEIVKIESELRRKALYWGAHPIRNRWGKRDSVSSARRLETSTQSGAKTCDALLLRSSNPARAPNGPVDLVAIGVSTGGPRMLPELLRLTGALRCPVAVAQHMPDVFTESFARQLVADTGLDVREGAAGMRLLPATVTILRGGTDSVVRRMLDGGLALDFELQADAIIHPSVNALFSSAARAARCPVGVIMTGMGDDGSEGARDFCDRGYPVLAQDPATCIVGGMPGAAIAAGVASESLSIEDLARRLRRWAGGVV